MKATGAHTLSILLGVIVLSIVLAKKNTTTAQMAILEKAIILKKNSFALDKIITAVNAKMKILNTATTLILGGYSPGYFPPMDAAPHGMPAARPA